MPPLKQRRLDAAAESSHRTSVEREDTGQLDDADCELPQHVVPVTTGGVAPRDTPKEPEALQHMITPASAPSAVGPKRVERDVVPVGAADTTKGQGETAADSEDEMCATSATLKRPLDD
ncbi:hypothetical protein HPB52_025071 [Rhipicephalus sanguineus]|uniref:Uncharacterized protein n=1 Tax=Rhipicephalus sanguineus TaxID=34632 RepID=A0A9D4YRP7_RHISA|nr:hypothetical protein HPB52_025071 [Rhipicephalus sanguineus]